MRVPDVHRAEPDSEPLMQTCTCTERTGVVFKPSGLVVCGDCGGALPMQPPKKQERP